MQRRLALTIAGALLAGSMLAGPADAQDKKTLALVTNASADFWTIARRGTEKAAAELPNYNIEMYVVSEATAAEQRRILDDLLTKGVAGVSISADRPRQLDRDPEQGRRAGGAVHHRQRRAQEQPRALYRHRQRRRRACRRAS